MEISHKYQIGNLIRINGTDSQTVPKLEIIDLLPESKYQCQSLREAWGVKILVVLNENQIYDVA